MKSSLRNKKVINIIFYISIFFVCLIGMFIRIYAWQHTENLFGDEGQLLHNIIGRNYLQLFLAPDGFQCCPPVFLILGKILYSIFGVDNLWLRILPFTFSVASLLLFVILSAKVINNKIGVLLSVFAFSLSEWCIFQQMFFKQYVSDCFFTVLVLLSAILLKDKKLSNHEMFLLSIFSSILVFCSYTAGFLILGIIIIYVTKNLIEAKTTNIKVKNIKPFLFYMVPFTILMTIFFFINCLPTMKCENLRNFWLAEYNILTFFPRNFDELKLFVKFMTTPFSRVYPSMIIFIITFFIIIKKDKFLCAILYLPFITASMLGLLKLYPHSPERVSLYIIPLFILIIFKSVDFISSNNKIISLIIITLTLSNISYERIYNQYSKIFKGNTSSIIEEYKERYKKEKVTLFQDFLKILKYSDFTEKDYIVRDYASIWVLNQKDTEKIDYTQIIWDDYGNISELEKLPINSNIYFYISEEYHFDYKELKDWITEHCENIYNIDCYNAEFIKCRKIR